MWVRHFSFTLLRHDERRRLYTAKWRRTRWRKWKLHITSPSYFLCATLTMQRGFYLSCSFDSQRSLLRLERAQEDMQNHNYLEGINECVINLLKSKRKMFIRFWVQERERSSIVVKRNFPVGFVGVEELRLLCCEMWWSCCSLLRREKLLVQRFSIFTLHIYGNIHKKSQLSLSGAPMHTDNVQ